MQAHEKTGKEDRRPAPTRHLSGAETGEAALSLRYPIFLMEADCHRNYNYNLIICDYGYPHLK